MKASGKGEKSGVFPETKTAGRANGSSLIPTFQKMEIFTAI
jgi:hypothetical protein